MRHTIKNLLNQEQKNILKSLKGETFDLLINEAGEFALSVLIEAPNRDIIIKNIPTEASDGDEYPKLVIEQAVTGIKIIDENAELLIIAHDSLAGLLKSHKINDDKSVDELLEDYWSMKTDHVNSLTRKEITIN
ncbi:hypothetical protein P4H61_03290 [Paenibacillus peoriae]|uniref:hypothetical protein n=1 Tax=Paenibacillus peoriae TaxID=59893 RepID=UPI00026C60C6|nr:hypothetical protein [Paenibacillus peoriae]MEC0180520.1 hypothetical protein [Paenibacillus peoriae]